MVSQCWWVLQFCWTHMIFCCCGRCSSHYCMALWCFWQMLLPCCHMNVAFVLLFGWCCSLVALLDGIDGDVYTIRLMFLSYLLMVLTLFVADVVTTLIQLHKNCAIGVCFVLADVIARMADVVAILRFWADVIALWLMLLPLFIRFVGWCYCLVVDVTATFSLVGWCYCLVADVIATCSDGRCYCL